MSQAIGEYGTQGVDGLRGLAAQATSGLPRPQVNAATLLEGAS